MIELAQAGKDSGGGAMVGNLLTFALIAGAMYMLVIRPQRKRARAVVAAQAAIEAGREVILTSGIYGTVLHVDTDRVGLEIAPGVTISVARAAVARVVDPPVVAGELGELDDEPGTPLS